MTALLLAFRLGYSGLDLLAQLCISGPIPALHCNEQSIPRCSGPCSWVSSHCELGQAEDEGNLN